MTEKMPLHRCKHCGYFLYSDDRRRKYHPECSIIVERNLKNEALSRFRKKHGNNIFYQWQKNNPEKRKKHMQTYTKKHRQERVDYNRQYRENHPAWYVKQLEKNNKKLHERRHTPGNCPKCGRKANKSSLLGFYTTCLYKRSDAKFRKRIDFKKIDRQLLRKEYEHLIPEQLYDPWVDEYLYIINSKVRLKMIEKTGEKQKWDYKRVKQVWDIYKEQQREYQTIHPI